MSTWYRVNKWTATIDPVEVISSTEKYLLLREKSFQLQGSNDKFLERRVAKQNEYFPTFREARTALMIHYSEEHKALLAEAERVHEKFTKVFRMDEEAPIVSV